MVPREDGVHCHGTEQRPQQITRLQDSERSTEDRRIRSHLNLAGRPSESPLKVEREDIDATQAGPVPEENQQAGPDQYTTGDGCAAWLDAVQAQRTVHHFDPHAKRHHRRRL